MTRRFDTQPRIHMRRVLTFVLFAIVSCGIVLIWNRSFAPVSWRVVTLFLLLVSGYQAQTLFTRKVDVPGNLAFVAYPWRALNRPPVRANTGIVFTQIAPWTRVARDAVLQGDAPLWNRYSASGAPLLANQQTAIFHPFTLLGLFLPLGKAFTLSACLRLFVVLLFTYIFLWNFELSSAAAVFGAIAYAFCSFHAIWLLFPLGLATMMLPACLAGVQELVRGGRAAAYVFLVVTLSCTILGGHPESALWVWLATIAFTIYVSAVLHMRWRQRCASVMLVASAFLIAMLATSFFWLPTLEALKQSTRFNVVQSLEANPADHGLSYEWLRPLVTPNVLGNPALGTYTPPRGFHPAVLNDYGEVASGYTGLITLALALASLFVARRSPVAFALGLMIFAFLTIAEAPVWRDFLRALPLAGVSIHQRLRIFWNLGTVIAASVAVDELMKSRGLRPVRIALCAAAGSVLAVYALRSTFSGGAGGLTLAYAVVPVTTALILAIGLRRKRWVAIGATCLVLADLLVATYRYNPPAVPADAYPITGAIATLQQRSEPSRFVALGWSFLPETPAYYGIEDVKTTDPLQHHRYMHFLRGYLDIDPSTYDLLIRDTSHPFFDFLNIRYLYLPPDHSFAAPGFVERYRGSDGTVFENTGALPRYFLVRDFSVEGDFHRAVGLTKQIADFRVSAVVDHIPAKVRSLAPDLQPTTGGGTVSVRRYATNLTELDIDSAGWNLLVSSDVHWPGWRAYWNGKRQPPVIVNGTFLGCFIPPGRGVLKFRYYPRTYENGLRTLGIAIVLLTCVAAFLRFRTARG